MVFSLRGSKIKVNFLSTSVPLTFSSCRQAFETFGLVVNEAMCFGLPIITSDAVGCATDLVQDGSGYIYPVGDVVRLGEYISHFSITHTSESKWVSVRVKSL